MRKLCTRLGMLTMTGAGFFMRLPLDELIDYDSCVSEIFDGMKEALNTDGQQLRNPA